MEKASQGRRSLSVAISRTPAFLTIRKTRGPVSLIATLSGYYISLRAMGMTSPAGSMP